MFTPIVRDSLISKLNGASAVPLTLLLAPPGSGKTTLIDQWQNQCSNEKFVRLNLGLRDAAPMVFFRRFLDGLKMHSNVLDTPAFDVFIKEMVCPASAICDAILLVLESVDTQLYIVLDDYQEIDSALVHQVMASVISQLPDHIHFVVSSRTLPELSVSRFRLSNQLVVISAKDLMINADELEKICETSIESGALSKKSQQHVLSLTEGWAAGVRLVLLVSERSGEQALDTLTGNQPELVDYFGHVVLKQLTQEVQDLLIMSSIFQEFNELLLAGLSENVGDSVSNTIFESIMHQGMFVVPVEGGLYRFHGLLRAFLTSRLHGRFSKQDVNRFHKRAAESWLLQVGDLNRCHTRVDITYLEQALRHAQLSGDDGYFLQLLRDVCSAWVKQGFLAEVIEALSEISDECILNQCGLFELLLSALTFSRRFNQAQYYLKFGLKFNDRPFYRALGLVLNVFLNDTDYDSASQLEALSEDRDAPAHVNAYSQLIVAYFQLQRGELDQAFVSASQSKALLSKLGFDYLASYADLIIALCDRYMGRGISAVAHISNIYIPLKDRTETPAWLNLATGMVVAYYEQNQIKLAQSICERLLHKVSFSSATEVVTTVYLHLARFLHSEGNIPKSERLIDRLERILVLGQYQRFKGQVIQESMRQALKEGDLIKARKVYDKYSLYRLYRSLSEKNVSGYCEARERCGLALSYYYLLNGQCEQAESLLENIAECLEIRGLKARALIARCNQIWVRFYEGHQELAATQLKQLISKRGLELFSRCVFDEVPGLADMMVYSESIGILELPVIYKKIFGGVLEQGDNPSRFIGKEDEKLDRLTTKEKQIYDLLVSGLSNAKISDQLSIALSTTKWHLKNIYSKLEVDNRTGAIVLARKAV